MLVVNNFPRPNEAQTKAILKEMQNNPSLLWDGEYGFYSSGVVIIDVSWDFDKTQTIYKVKFDLNGKRVI